MQEEQKSCSVKELSLEERIKRIIDSPVLELDGDAYKGKYELGNRRSITNFVKSLRLNEMVENVSYINLDTGDKIILSKRSAEKLATHADEIYQKTIAHIQEIIKNMKFLEKLQSSKADSKYKSYSYYITQAKIDGELYAVLSTVGREGNNIYYDQNVFKGSAQEVFVKSKNETNDSKYSRLNDIVRNIKEGDWHLAEIIPSESPITQEGS